MSHPKAEPKDLIYRPPKPGKPKEIEAKKGGKINGQKKVATVMREFKAGKLKSSSGQKVTNPKQAVAIGLSEAGMSKKRGKK
jgi:hypothetical protein